MLVHRSPKMVTCPGSWSIVGEHHSGRETDEQAAVRGLREELPGLAPLLGTRIRLLPLRRVPRWFLFDYPPTPDGSRRYDRCLISEYVVHVSANASEALSLLRGGASAELEHESSRMEMVPIGQLVRRLKRHPESFCAPELLPAALLDSYADLCKMLDGSRSSSGPSSLRDAAAANAVGCSIPRHAFALDSRQPPALPERLDLKRVIRGRPQSNSSDASARVAWAAAGQRARQLRATTRARPPRVPMPQPARGPLYGMGARQHAAVEAAPNHAAFVRRALEAAGLG